MSLPQGFRLKTWGQFRAVREEGKSYAGRFLVLGVLPDPASTGYRIGFITSRRVGGAVVRNRVRRQLRAIAREHLDRLEGGGSLVTIARFRAPEATYEQLRLEWLRLARKAGLLNDPRPRGKGEGAVP